MSSHEAAGVHKTSHHAQGIYCPSLLSADSWYASDCPPGCSRSDQNDPVSLDQHGAGVFLRSFFLLDGTSCKPRRPFHDELEPSVFNLTHFHLCGVVVSQKAIAVAPGGVSVKMTPPQKAQTVITAGGAPVVKPAGLPSTVPMTSTTPAATPAARVTVVSQVNSS